MPNMIGSRTVCPGLGLNTMPPLWRYRMGVDDRTGVRQISTAQEESLQCERTHRTLWPQNTHAFARPCSEEFEIGTVSDSLESEKTSFVRSFDT